MKVNEIFCSILGEGRYAGKPAIFIRLSGCNRKCKWCDTKYHESGQEINTNEIVKEIEKAGHKIVVWTGGEPALQAEEIYKVIRNTPGHEHHLETNGEQRMDYSYFHYVCFSPKTIKAMEKAIRFCNDWWWNECDIKVVTDLDKVNKHLITRASILMPLTTYDERKDREIKQRVWKFCIEHKKRYSPRLQVDVWGCRRGV